MQFVSRSRSGNCFVSAGETILLPFACAIGVHQYVPVDGEKVQNWFGNQERVANRSIIIIVDSEIVKRISTNNWRQKVSSITFVHESVQRVGDIM